MRLKAEASSIILYSNYKKGYNVYALKWYKSKEGDKLGAWD